MNFRFRNVALPVVAGLLISLALLPSPYHIKAQEQQNLLTNGSFEGTWHDISIGQQPEAWHWEWLDNVHVWGDRPVFAPESRVLPMSQVPERERDTFFRHGSQCVKIFKSHAPIYAALSQDRTLEVGRRYRFVAPIYVDVFDWDERKEAPTDPYSARVRLGAGPKDAGWPDENAITYSGWWDGGNTSPFFFAYQEYAFEFVATHPQMSVYAEVSTKWGFENSGFFMDDFRLIPLGVVHTPTPTAPPPPDTPTPGPSPTPLPPPPPRPDGASVHIVASGDTLFGIALMYGVDPDQIRELNATSLGPNDMIWPGQELVISLPSETPTPTPPPAPPTPTPAPTTDSSGTGEGTGGASVCVLAYHDRNGDTFRDQATEELLPNAEFTIADASGVVDRYTSDGISEPYCFTGLAPGAYRVIQNSPSGYEPSTPAEWPVAVAEGTSLDIQFGSSRSEGATSGETTQPTPAEESSESGAGSTVGGVFATVAKVSGVLVLILAAGVAVLFFLNRRRM